MPHIGVLAISPDGALWVTLEAAEDSHGTEAVHLAIRHGERDLDQLTAAQVVAYADTLRQAVIRASELGSIPPTRQEA